MASGFSGGRPGADFFAGFGNRSLAGAAMNNAPLPTYRSQLSGIFLDPSSQVAHRAASGLAGKRTLSEFQSQYHHQQQENHYRNHSQSQVLNGFNLRSVKPRIYNNTSQISLLSPIEYSGVNSSVEGSAFLQQSYGAPLVQNLRPQPIGIGNGNLQSTGPVMSGLAYINTVQNQVMAQESEKKMMTKLQELEKQLLDDNDEEDGGDTASVITNTNSEWSETIQNLLTPIPTPISPSPTSSTSSTSSSASVATSTCSKQSLMEAASAISDGKNDAASEILSRLAQSAIPRANSEQRLVDLMASALKSRLNGAENPPPVAELYSQEHVLSTQMLFDISPCFKLGFMAANQAIIEATIVDQGTVNKVHVLDFDIGQGGQYVNLLHALSGHNNGKPSVVKITTVADSAAEERLGEVREMLGKLADRVGVKLHFNVVSQKVTDLTRDSLGCDADEPLAVNFAFKLYRMPDESVSTENPRDELLRRVKGLSPRVVTLVEQEMNTNTAPFLARVAETSSYYGALLESIEAVARESPEKIKVEEGLARRVANSVACEGRDRVERCEVFGKWRARMGMAGFELKPLNQTVAESMRARLSSGNRVNPGFTVKDKNGGVCFGWMGRTLTVASAWR